MSYAPILILGIAIGAVAGLLFPPRPVPREGGIAAHDQGAGGDGPPLSAIGRRGAPHARPIGDLHRTQFDQPAGTDEEYEAYLERHGRSKEALLGVYFLSKDDTHLEEAARRYPDDPNVQLLVISKHLFPEERSQWIERFKASQPNNLIASIFRGGDLLARGEIEAGLLEMSEAADQEGYRDFVVENCFAMEAALVELGCPAVETKMRSGPLDVFRHVNPMNAELRRLEKLAAESPDPETKAGIARIGLEIGRQLDSGEAGTRLLNHLVARSMMERFAELLPAEESNTIPPVGHVQSQLDFYTGLDQRSGELNEQQYIHLLNRTRSEGAFGAMRWLSSQLDVPWEGAERWRD